MRRFVALVCLGLLVGCGSTDDGAQDDAVTTTEVPTTKDGPESTTTTTRPGDPAVWARIEGGTDCATLQSEFNTAMDNAERRSPGDPLRDLSMDYAEAADERMEEVGCYG